MKKTTIALSCAAALTGVGINQCYAEGKAAPEAGPGSGLSDKEKSALEKLHAEMLDAKKKYLDAQKALDKATGGIADECAEVPHSEWHYRNKDLQKIQKKWADDDFKDANKKLTEKKEDSLKNRSLDPLRVPIPELAGIGISKSLLSDDNIRQPATLNYSHPKDGEDTYDADATISYSMDKALQPLSLKPYASWHRNNSKDLLETGAEWSYEMDGGSVFAEDIVNALSLHTSWSNNDAEGKRYGGRIVWSPVAHCFKLGGVNLPISQFNEKAVETDPLHLRIRFQPQATLEWWHNYDSVNGTPSGNDGIWTVGVSGEWVPGVLLEKRVSVQGGWKMWDTFSRGHGRPNSDRVNHYAYASIDYFVDGWKDDFDKNNLTGKGHVALGVAYSHGTNPDEGKINEDLWTFGIKLLW